MNLQDIVFKAEYNKEYDNIVDDFYIKCMNQANGYDRVTGYFASTIYYICWDAVKDFVERNGKIRIVCSPCISDEDKESIINGYDLKSKKIIDSSVLKEINELYNSDRISTSYKLLSYLIANDYVEIKIGVPTSESPTEIKRMFHDKAGLFSDGINYVGFRGGINETYNGWSNEGNIDAIDVFTSWEDNKDKIRCLNIKNYFNDLWFKKAEKTIIYDFPEEAKAVLKEKSNNYNWEELVQEISLKKSKSYKWKPDKKSNKELRDHQIEALDNWVLAGRKGIFEHATGSGKTFTAICAIRDSLLRNELPLVLVPSKELLNQWHEEIIKNISGVGELHFLLCGDGNSKWRSQRLLNKITKNTYGKKYIIIAIMATACSDYFISEINQGLHLFVVADEVHRMGSLDRRKFFNVLCGPRLGLSATPRRYGDEVGTQAIFDYFGDVVKPVFTLQDAIKSGVLTKYFYYPVATTLLNEEQEEYNNISKEIKKMVAINSGDSTKLDSNNRFKTLLLNRARILKNAESKIDLAYKIIKENYQNGQKWIIYCDNINQLNKVLKKLEGFNAYSYYSSMAGDRDETLSFFESYGGIMVSIKCLDEGVDIPSTTHALILASSKNPREFIQRRGRILRTHCGKNLAFLYDAVILPDNSNDDENCYDSILLNEFARAIQFGSWAENPTCIAKLKNLAIDFNIDLSKYIDGGFEDEE